MLVSWMEKPQIYFIRCFQRTPFPAEAWQTLSSKQGSLPYLSVYFPFSSPSPAPFSIVVMKNVGKEMATKHLEELDISVSTLIFFPKKSGGIHEMILKQR